MHIYIYIYIYILYIVYTYLLTKHQSFTPQLAPENTLEAFRLAGEIDEVTVLESDVSISYDGVPFVLHDATLPRTTDVRLRFPRRALDLAASFNISDLQDLSAGTRFLEVRL